MVVHWVNIEGFYSLHTNNVDVIASFGKVSSGFAQNFEISVPSGYFPSLPGSNTGLFERLPSVSNAQIFGFS